MTTYARPLLDARAVAVDGRQDRADDSARDAAVVVAVKFRGLVLAEEPRAVLRLAALRPRASAAEGVRSADR